MAKAVFFLIMTFLLAGLIIHSKVFGDTKMAKVIAFIISAIAMYLIFSIGTHMICQMSDNMDDPACESDFFNAFFEVLGRWFGVDSWTREGRETARAGAREGAPAAPAAPGAPAAAPAGPVEGGCRLDITFELNSATALTSAAPVADYVKSVKAMGKTKVHVFGYASKEGGERYNFGLGGARGRTIANMIEAADPSIKASVSSGGPTSVFDPADYPPNRRVVVVTENIGNSVMPAPAPGTAFNCPTAQTPQVCGDQVVEGNEECDGNDDAKCPKKCQSDCTCPAAAAPTPPPTPTPPTAPAPIPPTCKNKANDPGEVCDPTAPDDKCPDDQHCADDCSKCEPGPAAAAPPAGGGGWFSWWYLLLLIPLLLLGLLGYRAGYHQYYKRLHGESLDDFNQRLLELIRLAKNSVAAITQNVKQNALTDPEKRLFKQAVMFSGPLMRRRIRNNLGPRGRGGVVFAPQMPPADRERFIDSVYNCAYAMRKAKQMLQSKYRYWFWPKLRTIHRLERMLDSARVSPIIHHDRSVTFNYYYRRNVLGAMPNPPNTVTVVLHPPAGAALNLVMQRPAPTGNIWTVKTNPLPHGDYRYRFRVEYPGLGRWELDRSNAKRTGRNPIVDFSQFTIQDIDAVVAAHVRNPP
jgi:outer membrane protein OmpA-like peptidoglycan-associated protein